MIVTCVHVHVRKEETDKFISETVINHRASLQEPGNLRFDLLQQADDPCRFMIYEAYESEEHAAAHKKTAHYLRWRGAVEDLMAEPRKGIRYDILEPSERGEW
jgi:(4S)-4-hydroxy-5-phosphonooxypentane-2,3-dione isomerase